MGDKSNFKLCFSQKIPFLFTLSMTRRNLWVGVGWKMTVESVFAHFFKDQRSEIKMDKELDYFSSGGGLLKCDNWFLDIFRLYYVRWNVFGSVPPLSTLSDDEHFLIVNGETNSVILRPPLHLTSETLYNIQPAYVFSMASLQSKADRNASPPPYDDPPSYDMAIAMMSI